MKCHALCYYYAGFESHEGSVLQRICRSRKDQEVKRAFAAFFIAAGKEEMRASGNSNFKEGS